MHQYIRNLHLTSTSTLYPAAIRSHPVATFFGVGICTRVTASRAVWTGDAEGKIRWYQRGGMRGQYHDEALAGSGRWEYTGHFCLYSRRHCCLILPPLSLVLTCCALRLAGYWQKHMRAIKRMTMLCVSSIAHLHWTNSTVSGCFRCLMCVTLDRTLDLSSRACLTRSSFPPSSRF